MAPTHLPTGASFPLPPAPVGTKDPGWPGPAGPWGSRRRRPQALPCPAPGPSAAPAAHRACSLCQGAAGPGGGRHVETSRPGRSASPRTPTPRQRPSLWAPWAGGRTTFSDAWAGPPCARAALGPGGPALGLLLPGKSSGVGTGDARGQGTLQCRKEDPGAPPGLLGHMGRGVRQRPALQPDPVRGPGRTRALRREVGGGCRAGGAQSGCRDSAWGSQAPRSSRTEGPPSAGVTSRLRERPLTRQGPCGPRDRRQRRGWAERRRFLRDTRGHKIRFLRRQSL